MPYQSISTSPEGYDKYFLVRPKGISPRLGRPWVPTVVQRLGDAAFLPSNEIEPIVWSVDSTDISKGCTANVFMAELEWCELPE